VELSSVLEEKRISSTIDIFLRETSVIKMIRGIIVGYKTCDYDMDDGGNPLLVLCD
jgi:hypothetical protein